MSKGTMIKIGVFGFAGAFLASIGYNAITLEFWVIIGCMLAVQISEYWDNV